MGASASVAGATTLLRQKHGNCPTLPIFLHSIPLSFIHRFNYVITHCAPTSIALMGSRHNEADRLTDFLQEVRERAKYHYWLFGHYHDNKAIDEKHILLWEQIVRVI